MQRSVKPHASPQVEINEGKGLLVAEGEADEPALISSGPRR